MKIEHDFEGRPSKSAKEVGLCEEELGFTKSLIYWAAERGILPDPSISMRHLNIVDPLKQGFDDRTRCLEVKYRIKSDRYLALIKVLSAISVDNPGDAQGRIRVSTSARGGDSSWFAMMGTTRWVKLIVPDSGCIIFSRQKATTDLCIGFNGVSGYTNDQLGYQLKYPGMNLDFKNLELVLKALVSEELMGLSPLSIEQRLAGLLS